MALKPFEKWNFEEIDNTFGYQRIYDIFAPLNNWATAAKNVKIDSFILQEAEKLRNKLSKEADMYNEDELKMQFIAPLLHHIDYDNFSKWRLFSQRKISAEVQLANGTTDILGGRVEAMVARGKVNPSTPYFFIHEYKPLNKTTPSDPLGQLVAAMIVAQYTNKDDATIYGLYVRGAVWIFVVLDGKQYTETKMYDATNPDDLYFILQMLTWVKIDLTRRATEQNA